MMMDHEHCMHNMMDEHHDCAHDKKHGHGHCKGKKIMKEVVKNLPEDSVERLFITTARKLMHSDKEALEKETAFATLTEQEKTELTAILKKIAAEIQPAEKAE